MPAFLKKKKERGKQRSSVISPSLWLFYLGLISMSLTGVTFSKYSTVVRGTISVRVADSYQVAFLDDSGEEVAVCRVYDGQTLSDGDIPEGSNSSETGSRGIALALLDDDSAGDDSTETIIHKKFLGWSLDGETIVDPAEIPVTEDLYFIAVYKITEKTAVKATPSNATLPDPVVPTAPPTPPMDPTVAPPVETVPETATETAGTADQAGTAGNSGEASGSETENKTGAEDGDHTVKPETPVIVASSSNAAVKE